MVPAQSPNPNQRHAIRDHKFSIGKGFPEFGFVPGLDDPMHPSHRDVPAGPASRDPPSDT